MTTNSGISFGNGSGAIPAGDNLIGRVKVTDGTNVAAVKAASTAPVAADPAVVVTLSPNSPLANDVTASGSITTQNLVPAGAATAGSAVTIPLSGQNTLAIGVTSAGTGALSVQVTVDGTVFTTLTGLNIINSAGSSVGAIPSATTGVWTLNVAGFAAVRVTALAAVTGTYAVSLRASSAVQIAVNAASNGTQVVLGASATTIGDVGVQYRATATGGASFKKVLTTASTNLASVKGTAGRLLGWTFTNTALAARFVHFYNVVTPTVGTTVPDITIPISTLQTVTFFAEGGIAMSTAISVSVTGAASATDLDNTNTAANDVTGAVYYA